MWKTSLLMAAVFGAAGVLFGAFGAHGLRELLEQRGQTEVWRTAALYHLAHAIAFLALAGVETWTGERGRPRQWFARARFCWAAGILLFSGSLYALALGAPRGLGPVTPLGGILLIAGWACLGVAAAREKEGQP